MQHVKKKLPDSTITLSCKIFQASDLHLHSMDTSCIPDFDVVPGAIFSVNFPGGGNASSNTVSLTVINSFLYCDLNQCYKAAKGILVHFKRKLERHSFKRIFKSECIWVRIVGDKSTPRIMYGQASRFVSIIMSVQSAVRDVEVRQTWTNLCAQLLIRETPIQMQNEVI